MQSSEPVMRDRPGFEIRTATGQDAELLAELGARLFEQAFGAMNDPENMRAYLASAFSPRTQTEELADPDFLALIAEDTNSVPIGYAMLRRGHGAPSVVA